MRNLFTFTSSYLPKLIINYPSFPKGFRYLYSSHRGFMSLKSVESCKLFCNYTLSNCPKLLLHCLLLLRFPFSYIESYQWPSIENFFKNLPSSPYMLKLCLPSIQPWMSNLHPPRKISSLKCIYWTKTSKTTFMRQFLFCSKLNYQLLWKSR